MAKITGKIWVVNIIERERGWGSKIDEVVKFDNKEEAIAFITEYNKKNTSTTAPDWYMQAEGPYEC